MVLADLIDRNAGFTPDKAAVRWAGGAYTYAAFTARIGAAARGLHAMGVGRGDRLGILAANHPDYLTLLYACTRLGAMLVPVNWRLAVPELVFILQDAGIRLLVLDESFASVLPAMGEVLPSMRALGLNFAAPGVDRFDLVLDSSLDAGGDGRLPHVDLTTPALIVYTSGTTGRPKGAVLTQAALFANTVMAQHMHSMTSADHILTVLPFFHVGGLNIQTTPALHLGATVTLHARFDAGATLAAIAGDRPTLTVLVPSTIQACLQHPDWARADLSSLRAVTTGSTMVPAPLVDAIERRGIPVLHVYGATETCPVSLYTRLGAESVRAGSTGRPGLLCEARVVDDAGHDAGDDAPGEVLVRGPQVFREYWGNAAATEAALHDGWYRTGDIGARHSDGTFTIIDRKTNLIVSGGENVYPAEVERVLLEHPSIQEAAVVGRAHGRWQEVPVAYVVCRPGATVTEEGVLAHVRRQLARFKVPNEVHFVANLPRNAMGKVQHFRLK